MKSKDRKPVKKVHLTNFHIAGFGYWEGCEAFEQLKIGTRLDLIREEDNPFDPYAVAIYYGEYKLGFIHRLRCPHHPPYTGRPSGAAGRSHRQHQESKLITGNHEKIPLTPAVTIRDCPDGLL